jgi:hypothetical protein
MNHSFALAPRVRLFTPAASLPLVMHGDGKRSEHRVSAPARREGCRRWNRPIARTLTQLRHWHGAVRTTINVAISNLDTRVDCDNTGLRDAAAGPVPG